MTTRERYFEALDRQCSPLPESLLLDCLDELIERDGVPDTEDDDALEERWDSIYAWGKARGVRVTV